MRSCRSVCSEQNRTGGRWEEKEEGSYGEHMHFRVWTVLVTQGREAEEWGLKQGARM